MQTAEQIQKVAVTLPDGSVRDYDAPVTGLQIAELIGKRLAKDALAVKIDGTLRDLTTSITTDAAVEIVTRDHADALGLIRHDAAHVMAEAVQELYPGTQVTIGPAIENGFYYDFARPEPFTPDDLAKIEAKMREIVARDARFVREVWDRDEAIRFFEDKGEKYKAELIRDLPGDGGDLDLLPGRLARPVPRPAHAVHRRRSARRFKLTKVAGAYWRGDHRNAMLQRIYGTAWRDEKELEAYLHQLEEAEKRDHRRIGREMDLFHLQEEAVGAVFWHPKGYTL